MLASIQSRISPLLHIDIIGRLPLELARCILKHLDVADLLNCSLVCKRYYNLINTDQLLWKALYVRAGWKYDRAAVEWWGAQGAAALQKEQEKGKGVKGSGKGKERMESDEGMGEEEEDFEWMTNTKGKRREASDIRFSIDDTNYPSDRDDEDGDEDTHMMSSEQTTSFLPNHLTSASRVGLPPSPRHKVFPPLQPSHHHSPSPSITYNYSDRPISTFKAPGLPASPKDRTATLSHLVTPPHPSHSRRRKSIAPSWATPTRVPPSHHPHASSSSSSLSKSAATLDIE
ncbi:hypothetical protein BT69DRAFT_1050186 [Atractiella rhizophila]|nr:hypothetical protein BT69DRAFT_1050186 [Atractiella rhizophila]